MTGWLLGGLLAALVLIAPIIGIFVQPWAPFWLAGSTQNAPGVVPIEPPLQGPLPAERDEARLMAIIHPWIGSPYVFGGNGPPGRGVDCSGFTQQVYRALGVSLPRTAQTQYDVANLTLQPRVGDLVFFQRTYSSPDRITHVGVYVGEGMMISAAEPAVGRQSLTSPFWRSHLAGYGRVLK